MILQGSIERFGMACVLQFLARSKATGIVEVRDFEEQGAVYLVEGRIQAISLPVTDGRLGVHLVRSGDLTEEQLARALVDNTRDGSSGRRKTLGERLVELGFVATETVRQAVHRLTVRRLFELVHWRSGVFNYDEPPDMPLFRIPIRGDVEELLLLVQHRIDEGHRPRKNIPRSTPVPCRGCPVNDCTPELRAAYLKRDVCLWRKMSAVVSEAQLEPRRQSGGGVALEGMRREERPRSSATLSPGPGTVLEACLTTLRDSRTDHREEWSL